MNANVIIMSLAVFSFCYGCSGGNTYHKAAVPDPKSYNAHFGDMDTNGDDQVSREEFNAYFPQADPNVFQTVDLNADGSLDHDEWHQFKSSHGMKHQN
jgi:hypothetical protein